jgi:parallel beta-helix repeat protein
MGRKVVAIWLCISMLFGFVVIVDVKTGSGGAYTSIQDAINASIDGDTVFVYNGTYYENVVVNKSLNLNGEDINTTIVNGGGSGDVVQVIAGLVNITGLNITNSGGNSGDAGIELNNVQYCKIYNNNVSSNHQFGIYLQDSHQNNITGNRVMNNQDGIHISGSSGNIIHGNDISLNNSWGIYIIWSSNNNITDNKVSSNIWGGIYLYSSSNYIVGNNISSNGGYGIFVYSSPNTKIIGNILIDYGIFIDGGDIGDWNTHNIDSSNTVNGKPVHYWKDQTGGSIPPGAGQVILANCQNINIENQDLESGTADIELAYSSNNNITGNNASSNHLYGIYLRDSHENNITGNNFSNNWRGVHLERSSNNNITNNNVSLNSEDGFYLIWSSDNNITDNNISQNGFNGMNLYSSSNYIAGNNISSNKDNGIYVSGDNNIISNNFFFDNYFGIYLDSTRWNNITGNTMVKNGIFIEGFTINRWNTHDIDTSNTVNGKSVFYWKNKNSGTIPSDAGQVILANCNNIRIENQELMYGSVGILFGFSSNNNITDNNITNNKLCGIYLYSSNKNLIIGNNVSSNNEYGLSLVVTSQNNVIINNTSSNNAFGMYISDYSSGNNISSNIASNNDYGIYLFYNSYNIVHWNNITDNVYGIYLNQSKGNNLASNIMIENGIFINGELLEHWNTHIIDSSNTVNGKLVYYWKNQTGGIIPSDAGQVILANCTYVKTENQELSNGTAGIELGFSSDNKITKNNISNNEFGIFLLDSSNNDIYHNNINNNTNQAFDNRDNNYWDSGYPSGGNYWSDYIGFDNYKGPYQDIPGSDGIGDSPYIIDADSQDNYPLMMQYIPKPLENYTILKQGWNLISIPLIQDNQDLSKVLEMIDGWYDAVQWYEVIEENDPWKHHKVGKPNGNDLFELNETIGFWIHITQPWDTIFLYNGTQPTSNQTIPLHPGWNMVGYPSLTSYNRTEGLNNLTFNNQVDAIRSYNAATQKWEEMGETDYFEIGKGYYIHAKSECEWEVPL